MQTTAIDWSQRHRPEVVSQIVSEFLPLANKVALKRIRSLPKNVDQAMVYSAANMGLLRAISTYAPGKSSFATYAQMRIDKSILDAMRVEDPVSRKTRADSKQHANIAASLTQQVGHNVSDDEFEELTGHKRRTAPTHQSIDAEKALPLQVVSEPTEYERSEAFRMATRGLTLDEQTILYLYYYKSARMKEIGSIMGLSESRVSQMCKAILETLEKFKPRVIDALVTR